MSLNFVGYKTLGGEQTNLSVLSIYRRLREMYPVISLVNYQLPDTDKIIECLYYLIYLFLEVDFDKCYGQSTSRPTKTLSRV